MASRSDSPMGTPRVTLDGVDLGDPLPDAVLAATREDDEARRRELQVEELRRQLTASPAARGAQQDLTSHEASSKDVSAEPSIGRRRRVQWVGLGEDDRSHDHETHLQHHPDHVSVPMPTISPSLEVDGYPFSLDPVDGASDGFRTPGGGGTGSTTPNTSRPGTPDELHNIPEGELDGLPLASNKRGKTFTREANKLVAVHKAKMMFMQKRSNHHRNQSTEEKGRSVSNTRGSKAAMKTQYDDDAMPSAGPSRPAPASGVLSALLKLYEQPQSLHSSQATLVPSRTTSPSEPSSPLAGVPSRPDSPVSGSHSPETSKHRAPDQLPTPVSYSTGERRRSHQNLGHFFKDAAHKLSDYHHDTYERPSAARSRGGVFGALQASAFSLAGAATPHGATVAPAPHRPGYGLSRYSLPEIPTQRTLQHSATTNSSGDQSPRTPMRANTPPGLDHPSLYNRRAGSHLSLSGLGKNMARMHEDMAVEMKEKLKPERFYHQSAAMKARSSGSQPGTPKEYADEKGKAYRRKKDKRRQEEIFITMHVAAILQRQDFILRLARALMMFGAPSHRLEYQLQQTAKVLDVQCQVIYVLNFMIVSFSDPDTHTSEIKFIKQAPGLDIGKLTDLAILHWEVVHDKIGVQEASIEISNLMKSKPTYNNWLLVAFGGWCTAMISMASFNASFIDLLVSVPLGALLVAVQCFIAARSDILSSIFEVIIAAAISFAAAALASTNYFCYAAITSSSIVLILPGWPVCVAALELQTRSLVSGSVRIVYAVVYSLFLGFGISMGANIWQLIRNSPVTNPNDNLCVYSHPAGAAWWHQTIPPWFYWIAVPGFPLGLALRNQARFNKELAVMVLIAGAGWNANHWSTLGFPGRSDISSALGALVVGLLGNLWGKFFQSTSFIVSVVPILFQLPSGLGNGGLLNFASNNGDSAAVFQSGWSVAQQLITVVIGLVVGLLISCAIFYPFGKRRGGLMTF